MSRVQLFEWEDQPWFPAAWREAMTEFLGFVGTLSDKPYVALSARVAERMSELNTSALVDLCSGAGGPSITLAKLLHARDPKVHLRLTDLYPPRASHAKAELAFVERDARPVDSRDVPEALAGFRVMFNAFHHFAPDDARAVLADAVAKSQGIAVYELNGRSLPSLLSVLFSPLTLWLVTPLLRPFRWTRLLWTYVLPVLPLAVLWDGIVSCLRVYSPDELRALVATVPGAEGFRWEIGGLPVPGAPIEATYLIGAPRPSSPGGSSDHTRRTRARDRTG